MEYLFQSNFNRLIPVLVFFSIQVQSKESAGLVAQSGGAWDPHDMNAVAVTCESSIQFWDLRTMKYVSF